MKLRNFRQWLGRVLLPAQAVNNSANAIIECWGERIPLKMVPSGYGRRFEYEDDRFYINAHLAPNAYTGRIDRFAAHIEWQGIVVFRAENSYPSAEIVQFNRGEWEVDLHTLARIAMDELVDRKRRDHEKRFGRMERRGEQ